MHHMGKVLVLVEKKAARQLEPELEKFYEDLVGDGWIVVQKVVHSNSSVGGIKEVIRREYVRDPINTKSVVLIGNIPVPYSGNVNPDSHSDHQGAWPADMYYGDMDGVWTDTEVNIKTSKDPRNHNIPGDNKFDQSEVPGAIELQVGRIDFSDLDLLQKDEISLLREYLMKNHRFRHNQFAVNNRALLVNNFKEYKEGFAQNGWKNFSPMFGRENIHERSYAKTLTRESYLWAYGCGDGSYQTCKGVIDSKTFARNDFNCVFNMLFGSYFGDWDTPNNLLRISLASGSILTACWAGRPNWVMHRMGLGETIGQATLLTQNNKKDYVAGFWAKQIHIALMGDPTLKQIYFSGPESIDMIQDGNSITLQWEPVNEEYQYYVYRKSAEGNYSLLNSEPVKSNFSSYTDYCLEPGTYQYMVRAERLESTASGSYYNLSQGTFTKVINVKEPAEIVADFDYYFKNGATRFVNLTNNVNGFSWDFGDGTKGITENPTHYYAMDGEYKVKLRTSNPCGTGEVEKLVIFNQTPTTVDAKLTGFNIFPSPVSNGLNLHVYTDAPRTVEVNIFDLQGELHMQEEFDLEERSSLHELNIDDLKLGVYEIKISDGKSQIGSKRFIIN